MFHMLLHGEEYDLPIYHPCHKSKTNIQEYNPQPLLHQLVHGWIFSQAATNTEKATSDGAKKIPNRMNDDTRKLTQAMMMMMLQKGFDKKKNVPLILQTYTFSFISLINVRQKNPHLLQISIMKAFSGPILMSRTTIHQLKAIQVSLQKVKAKIDGNQILRHASSNLT